jgi:predicted HicB family RNase H-like nuclease
MPPTATDLGCPQCAAGGISERVMQTGTGFKCSKGHEYHDTGELMAMQPKRMPLPPKAPVIMLPGYVKTEIAIPGNLKTALESKFGVRLNATIVAILTSIMDPGAFVMSSEDVAQMGKYFSGKNVRHGAELMGEVFAIFQERANLKEQLERKESVSFSGGLMVRPSPETLAALKQVASTNGKSSSQVAAECLDTAVRNNWL